MSYFKINGKEFSDITNSLTVSTVSNYNSQINAAGDTVVDYINKKRVIKVGVIPLSESKMKELLTEVDKFNVVLSFRNPKTGNLEENVNCIIAENEVDYYTIQVGKVSYNALKLDFTEL